MCGECGDVLRINKREKKLENILHGAACMFLCAIYPTIVRISHKYNMPDLSIQITIFLNVVYLFHMLAAM